MSTKSWVTILNSHVEINEKKNENWEISTNNEFEVEESGVGLWYENVIKEEKLKKNSGLSYWGGKGEGVRFIKRQ